MKSTQPNVSGAPAQKKRTRAPSGSSCALCRRLKAKCDGRPCSNCVHRGKADTCGLGDRTVAPQNNSTVEHLQRLVQQQAKTQQLLLDLLASRDTKASPAEAMFPASDPNSASAGLSPLPVAFSPPLAPQTRDAGPPSLFDAELDVCDPAVPVSAARPVSPSAFFADAGCYLPFGLGPPSPPASLALSLTLPLHSHAHAQSHSQQSRYTRSRSRSPSPSSFPSSSSSSSSSLPSLAMLEDSPASTRLMKLLEAKGAFSVDTTQASPAAAASSSSSSLPPVSVPVFAKRDRECVEHEDSPQTASSKRPCQRGEQHSQANSDDTPGASLQAAATPTATGTGTGYQSMRDLFSGVSTRELLAACFPVMKHMVSSTIAAGRLGLAGMEELLLYLRVLLGSDAMHECLQAWLPPLLGPAAASHSESGAQPSSCTLYQRFMQSLGKPACARLARPASAHSGSRNLAGSRSSNPGSGSGSGSSSDPHSRAGALQIFRTVAQLVDDSVPAAIFRFTPEAPDFWATTLSTATATAASTGTAGSTPSPSQGAASSSPAPSSDKCDDLGFCWPTSTSSNSSGSSSSSLEGSAGEAASECSCYFCSGKVVLRLSMNRMCTELFGWTPSEREAALRGPDGLNFFGFVNESDVRQFHLNLLQVVLDGKEFRMVAPIKSTVGPPVRCVVSARMRLSMGCTFCFVPLPNIE